MAIFALGEHTPQVSDSAWISDSAQIIGRVEIADEASIWPGAVLRGDLAKISVGTGSNLQDNVIVHTDNDFPCKVADHVTVGHGAILHGCTIESGALIGMGAIVLNGAVIGKHALVGAGALVSEGKTIPERALVVGTPARFVRFLTDQEVEELEQSAKHYAEQKEIFRTELRRIDKQPNQS